MGCYNCFPVWAHKPVRRLTRPTGHRLFLSLGLRAPEAELPFREQRMVIGGRQGKSAAAPCGQLAAVPFVTRKGEAESGGSPGLTSLLIGGDSELPSSSFLRSLAPWLQLAGNQRDEAACVLSTWTTSPRRLSVYLGLLLDAGFRLLRFRSFFYDEVFRDHSEPGGFRQLPKLSAPPGSSVLVPTATVPNFPS